jgi:hypothetical protein
MTKTEKMLRDALLKCHAQLCKHQTALNSPEVDEAVGIASDALIAPLTATPVFYVSGSYVRGPARPEGSGFKEVVFKLPSPKSAEMTADTLNSMFAAYCVHPEAQASS